MSQLNSKELLQNIKDVINAPKPARVGIDYFTPELHYAALRVATLNERERIIKLLNLEDVLPHLNTREGNWVHKDTLIALIKGENK